MQILNSDPYNVDAQKKIEEMIRHEAVLENMEHAMEYSVSRLSCFWREFYRANVLGRIQPESFGNVHMLCKLSRGCLLCKRDGELIEIGCSQTSTSR
jgi:hypothetical protein